MGNLLRTFCLKSRKLLIDEKLRQSFLFMLFWRPLEMGKNNDDNVSPNNCSLVQINDVHVMLNDI